MDRQLVRVEDVALTVEIKSELKSKHLLEGFKRQNKNILQLKRFYRPQVMLDALLNLAKRAPKVGVRPDTVAKLSELGVSPLERYESIPAIPNFFFAYKGISKETASEYLQYPFVDAVCVLGAYTVSKPGLGLFFEAPEHSLIWAEGDDALGAFMHLLERVLDEYLHSRIWVRSGWERYFKPMKSRGGPHGVPNAEDPEMASESNSDGDVKA